VGMQQPDHAYGGMVEPGDAVEDGGLACAVRSDQRGDLATLRDKIEIVDRDQAAEPHGEMINGEDRFSGRVHRSPASVSRPAPPPPRLPQVAVSACASPQARADARS